jgi:hypothetical protein
MFGQIALFGAIASFIGAGRWFVSLGALTTHISADLTYR